MCCYEPAPHYGMASRARHCVGWRCSARLDTHVQAGRMSSRPNARHAVAMGLQLLRLVGLEMTNATTYPNGYGGYANQRRTLESRGRAWRLWRPKPFPDDCGSTRRAKGQCCSCCSEHLRSCSPPQLPIRPMPERHFRRRLPVSSGQSPAATTTRAPAKTRAASSDMPRCAGGDNITY